MAEAVEVGANQPPLGHECDGQVEGDAGAARLPRKGPDRFTYFKPPRVEVITRPAWRRPPDRRRRNAGGARRALTCHDHKTAAGASGAIFENFFDNGIVARPADGKANKDRVRTTLFAYVTSRLSAGRGTQYYKGDLRVSLNETVVATSGNARRWKPGEPDPATAGWSGRLRGRKSLFRPWLLVDEEALGVYRAVVHFRAEDLAAFDALQARLRRTVGVSEVHACDDGETVFAVVLWREPADKRRLIEHFRRELAIGRRPRWYVIESSRYPAAATWRQLTREAADDDELLLDSRTPEQRVPSRS